ncbi:hypothetical protein LCGC14_2607540, partial [marine sediment metagenome]
MQLTSNAVLDATVEKKVRNALRDARSTDAIEDGIDSYIPEEWVLARRQQTSF